MTVCIYHTTYQLTVNKIQGVFFQRDILNAFPGMTGRTYWLRNVDGLNRRASEHSSSSETEDESCCTEKSGGKFCII